ncbi:putative phage tail protein [Paenibacillus lautus]|uniref:putative phage tail protein n=1 Tax=Paenibacillus lautus TaxID=1401 RepID=UPI001C7D8DD8|nr:putative phage tail protein [Paenibacillus lautus]MBX4145977.1 YmfQ family protein [Paenibacillus lautus]
MSGSDRLKGYLPKYYDGVLEMEQMVGTEGPEVDLMASRIEELLNQSYPESATWAISRYERDLQIVAEAGKPIEQRRSVVISKMRGHGKVSGSLIKNVAQAYDGGQVDVSVTPAAYKITITFIDTLGIPSNLDDLKNALNDIKPAHLTLVYEFRFLLVRDIHNVMTFDQLKQTPFSKMAFRRK